MARAGGSRGGGGGGRGFGTGAGRSFGGRAGGSSGGGSFKRGGLGGGSSMPGGSRNPPRGGTPGGLGGFGGYGGYGGGPRYGYGPGGPPPPPPPRRRRGYYGGPGYYGTGCFTMVAVVLLVVAFSAVLVFGAPAGTPAMAASGNSITKSTIEREPLPSGSVDMTGYYTDDLGWVSNPSLLLGGMEHFYTKTGVQPYLYLASGLDGNPSPTASEAGAFADSLYDELFTDEAHFLLIFTEYNNQYQMWYLAGTQAKSVMDDEACNILLDYVDKYYYDSSLSDEQIFSKAFENGADRIMQVTRSPLPIILGVVGALVALVLLFLWWRNSKRQRAMEDARTAEILRTPLETYGDTEAERLAQKYNNNDPNL